MGKSCGRGRRGKCQFKKGSDSWKFSIWKRVMGSQPIRIQLGKILWENLTGSYCGKFLQEILTGKSCGRGRRGKSQFKKGSDWWKFSIWTRVMGSPPILREMLWENLAGNFVGNYCGKSCRKFLWKILSEILWKILLKILREMWKIVVGKSCGKLLQENLVGNVTGKCGRKSCGKFL